MILSFKYSTNAPYDVNRRHGSLRGKMKDFLYYWLRYFSGANNCKISLSKKKYSLDVFMTKARGVWGKNRPNKKA